MYNSAQRGIIYHKNSKIRGSLYEKMKIAVNIEKETI